MPKKWRLIYYKSYLLPELARKLSDYYNTKIEVVDLEKVFKRLYGYDSTSSLTDGSLKQLCSIIRMKSAREYGIVLKVHPNEPEYNGLFIKQSEDDWADITIHDKLIQKQYESGKTEIHPKENKGFELWGLTKH